MNNYLVSVILPNYCHAPYLKQRIDSILNQTFQNFELIILDDNSPDDGASKSVIEQYRGNPHVTHIIYNEVNSGSTFKQWSLGFSLAKGNLIWIAESDDYCEPDLLESLVSEFKNNANCVLAFSLSKRVDSHGKDLDYFELLPISKITRLNGEKYVKRFMTTENFCANASACLFLKDAALCIPDDYTKLKASGDYLFWIELALLGNISIINRKKNYFRQHTQKVTTKSYLRGINQTESFGIYNYLLGQIKMSSLRKFLIKCTTACTIYNTEFESHHTKDSLLNLYQIKRKPSFWVFILVKLINIFQHRFYLYL
ncbi:glycosyltransferase family 2 protein [Segatella copri]|jgi:glycosyltransferase involved in cell wall biosynthesis|uniref:glycosyltransferase family 2 protein n=1 Tax=Segatella copri TaxID=165179 RepID=UPI001932B504|nr:glycosyltransferase family 2 protein [Segatella copri]MBM0153156.1 glycosyltransferase family 2 protein [Segatella copri]